MSRAVGAADAHRSSLIAVRPARPKLMAPSADVLKRGENLRRDMMARTIMLERELKIGSQAGSDCDIVLPGNSNSHHETLQEYVPLLIQAIELDRSATLRRLLEVGVNPNSYFLGRTPMGQAALVGYVEMVRILHTHGADLGLPYVSVSREAEFAPLHGAAMEGHSSVVRYLLDNGADIHMPRERSTYSSHGANFVDDAGATAIWLACHDGQLGTVILLQAPHPTPPQATLTTIWTRTRTRPPEGQGEILWAPTSSPKAHNMTTCPSREGQGSTQHHPLPCTHHMHPCPPKGG